MVKPRNITPENTEFVILSFEGPDPYSLAGGLGVRVQHLATTLAEMGFTTHLFFIGDPRREGQESRLGGKLTLRRWCQWVSKYYPSGVYEGENEKLYDFNDSLPGHIRDTIIKPAVARGKLVAVLGEEWHTSEAMSRLSDALHYEGLRDKVVMFWNANNTFSFHRINWSRLNFTTTITTVSRYMKHIMWRMGLNPLVIPNGIPRSLFSSGADDGKVRNLRQALPADLMLSKVARWDPDKRWNQAIEAIAFLKNSGLRTILIARGGIEPHGQEVLHKARSLGLTVTQAHTRSASFEGYVSSLREAATGDIIDVTFPLPLDFLRVMYEASDGVLANSGHEPFGLVGLEAMAAGGIAFTGCTGEDYAIPFVNCFVLETADPMEIVGHMLHLKESPETATRMRQAARGMAQSFTWEAAIRNLVSKLEYQARMQGTVQRGQVAVESEAPPPEPAPISPLAPPEDRTSRRKEQEMLRVRVPA